MKKKNKNQRNPLNLLIIVMLVSVLLLGSVSLLDEDGEHTIVEIVIAGLQDMFPDQSAWDATEFLVGEFYASTGCLVRFDGRGQVTCILPDGRSSVGEYSMTEQHNRVATVLIDISGSARSYSFDLLSENGAFTLMDEAGDLSVFTPVRYEIAD